MNQFAQTLWDLIAPRSQPVRPSRPALSATPKSRTGQSARQQRYDQLVADMKREHGVRVRKWRTSTSGCAWAVHYSDGSMSRLIESPYPRGAVSCGVFLHEIGHHVIGLGRYRPRCLEEYHAWAWSLRTMQDRGFRIAPSLERRVHESLHYAVAKAQRRGLKSIPEELWPYVKESAVHSNGAAPLRTLMEA